MPGTSATVTGWGHDPVADRPITLRGSDVPTASGEDCVPNTGASTGRR